MDRARRIGWIVFAMTCAAIAGRTVLARWTGPSVHLTPQQRMEVARDAAAQEPKWALDALHLYPADNWSQDDDFYNSEHRWVRDEAGRRGVPQSEIFDAIDRDLRSHPTTPPRKDTAAPCKPRPFYD